MPIISLSLLSNLSINLKSNNMKTPFIKISIGVLSLALFLFTACKKTPSPCVSVDKGSAAKVNEEVQFDASCSKNVSTYTWDFGDGTSMSGNPVKHKYSTQGTYLVKLTEKNGNKTASSTQNLTINP